MTFNSVQYFAFLAGSVLLYWTSHPRLRPVILLVASYLFYATWNWRFVPLLVFATGVTFLAGKAIPGASASRQRLLTWLAVGSSAGVVVGFKTAVSLAGGNAGGGGIGIGLSGAVEAVVIPVGLSFYTFQVISYVIDIRRGDVDPEPSIVTYALYVSFFPHLLAGPVVRAGRLIPQLHNRRKRPEPVAFKEGLELIALGLFKKVAVADVLIGATRVYLPVLQSGDPQVGTAIAIPAQLVVLLGNYFDIWGYVDIARGSAKLFGVRMPSSFAQPFTRSRSWTEFWRRWQVNIMGWFRDYVYRPVRGTSRRHLTALREAGALLATFLAAGLWHGLTLGWLVWGFGTAMIMLAEQRLGIDKVLAGRGKKRPKNTFRLVLRQLRRSLYLYVCLLLVTPWAGTASLAEGLDVYRFFFQGIGTVDPNLLGYAMLGIAATIVLDNVERRDMDREGFAHVITTRRWFAYGVMLVAVIVASGGAPQDFVYFKF